MKTAMHNPITTCYQQEYVILSSQYNRHAVVIFCLKETYEWPYNYFISCLVYSYH